MRLIGTLIAVTTSAALATATNAEVQGCRHATDESVDQRARREGAIRYVRAIKAAEDRVHVQRRTYVSLVEAEAAVAITAPFGFVPRLTFDQWSYALILKDVLDPCGFSLFADQDTVIYTARPLGDSEPTESRTP